MKYRGVEVFTREGTCMPFYSRDGLREYAVNVKNGLGFGAVSKFGESWGLSPEVALGGAKTLIDRALD